MVLAKLFGVLLFGEEAKLKVVSREAIDTVDEILQRREVVPRIRRWNGHDGAFCSFGLGSSTFGSLSSCAWMAIVAVMIRLATRWEHAEGGFGQQSHRLPVWVIRAIE